ncbi:hypothetical protein JHK87_002975 [Glycine soja]|nr:hypothetical protein JHK87_002975 [Glycine soja]
MKAASIVVSNDKQGDANACLLDGDPPYTRSVSDFLIQMRTRGATQHANGNSTESVDDQDIDFVELLEENFDVVGGINMENFLKNYAHDADETDSSKDYEPNSDVLAHHLDEANSRVSADDTDSCSNVPERKLGTSS